MAAFPVLNTIQPFAGCDMHLTIPPPPPAPPPHTPHVVVWVVGLSQKMNFLGMAVGTSKANSPESGVGRPVVAGWGYACARAHDGGPHPGHIWPNLLLPLILLGSSSKHEFASGTVLTPKGEMAVGVAWVVDLALDCWDVPYPPLPTGITVTAANTVRAGFTWADFFRGLIHMVVDAAITWAIGMAFSKAGGAFASRMGYGSLPGSFFGKNAPGFFAKHGRLFVDSARAFLQATRTTMQHPAIYQTIGESLLQWGLGSPMGAAAESNPWQHAQGPIDNAIDGLFR